MYICVHYFLKGDDMRTKGIRKRAKGFISLLLIISVMVSLLVPFNITAIAEEAPATGANIRAVVYNNNNTHELVFLNAFSALPTDKGTLIWDSFDQNLDGDQSDRINVSEIVPYEKAVYEPDDKSKDSWRINNADSSPLTNEPVKIPWRKGVKMGSVTSLNIQKVTFQDKIQPKSTAFWFNGLNGLQSIVNIENLDTSEDTCMTQMFMGCSSLKVLDVSHFDTRNVKSTWDMFCGCSKITKLDVSNWDMSNVGGAAGMFYQCRSLEELDTSKWYTPNMYNMQGMFRECRKLKKIDLGNFSFENMWLMQDLFFCNDFSTSSTAVNFKDVNDMALEEVIFPESFSTPNLRKTYRMFAGCSKLKSINLHGMSFDKVNQAYMMFYKCKSLESLDINGLSGYGNVWLSESSDNANIIGGIFEGCSKLGTLDVSGANLARTNNNIDKSKAIYKDNMFAGTEALKELKLGGNWKAGFGSLETAIWKKLGSDPEQKLAQEELLGGYQNSYAGTWVAVADIAFVAKGATPGIQTVEGSKGDVINYGDLSAERTGYKFDGWYTERSGGTKFNSGDTADQWVYYAHWTPIKYNLTLDGNGGKTADNQDTIVVGSLDYDEYYQLSKKAFTSEGKVLTHWSTRKNDDGVDGVSYDAVEEVSRLTTSENANITLFAQWHSPDVWVEFDPDGGSAVPKKHYTLNNDEDTFYGILSESAKKDYTFLGWYYDDKLITAETPIWNDSHALKAHWAKNPTITFHANGGAFADGNDTTTKTVRYNSELGSIQTPKLANHIFVGWYTAPTGGDEVDKTQRITAETVDYYAHWGYKPVFDLDGGSILNFQGYEVHDNPEYQIDELPTNVIKEGYSFAGWTYNDLPLTAPKTLNLSENNVIKATWTERTKLTITLDTDGGTIDDNRTTVDVYEGDTIKEIPIPHKDGYNFLGWYVGDTRYTEENEFTENITLTAKWEEKNYTLTFKPGPFAYVFKTNSTTLGQDYELKAAKGKPLNELPGAIYFSGGTSDANRLYTLEGWYPNSDYTGDKLDTNTPITSDGTYYAKWVQNVVNNDAGYSYSINWWNATSATVSNVSNNLNFIPNNKDNLDAILYVSFDTGSKSFEKGTVKIKIPKFLFADWKGEPIGEASVKAANSNIRPYADAAGSESFHFGYVEYDDYYELINYKDLGTNDESYAQIHYTVSPLDIDGGAIDSDGNIIKDTDNENKLIYPYYTNTITPTISIREDEGETFNQIYSKDLSVEVHTKVSTSQRKESNSVYFSWDRSWGDEPVDSDEYFYIKWKLTENSTNATNQPFKLIWSEETVHDGTVVQTPSEWTDVDGQTRISVEQYIITKHSKSEVFGRAQGNTAEVKNEAVVTEEWQSGYRTYHRSTATAQIYIPNTTTGGIRSFTKQITSKNISDPNTHYIKGGQEDIVDENKEVKIPYVINYSESAAPDGRAASSTNDAGYTASERTYSITDGYSDSVLMTEGKGNSTEYYWAGNTNTWTKLSDTDYRFGSIKISLKEYDSNLVDAKENKWASPYEHTERDSYEDVFVYFREKGDENFNLLETFSPFEQVTEILLPDNTSEFKIEHSSSFFATSISVTVDLYIKPTDKVKNLIKDHMREGQATAVVNSAKLTIKEQGQEDINLYTKDFEPSAYPAAYLLDISETDLYAEKNCADKARIQQDPTTNTETMAAVISGWNYNNASSSNKQRRLRSGTFYDLLPVGYSVDKSSVFVVPRFINATTETKTKKANNYYTVNANAKLNSLYYDVQFENNYQGSGQTMMTIKVSIPDSVTVNNKNGIGIVSDGSGVVPNGVDVYYLMKTSYENVVVRGENSANSVAFINTSPNMVKPKACFGSLNSEIQPQFRKYFNSIETENKDCVAYNYALTNAEAPQAFSVTFKNRVKTKDQYEKSGIVGTNSPYTYRITYTQTSTAETKNLIFYDVLEAGTEDLSSDWYGTFQNVDVSSLTDTDMILNNGNHCAPVIYYSTTERKLLTQDNLDINKSEYWTTTRPENEAITAVAVDCSRSETGDPFIFSGQLDFNIYIDMLSPEDVSANDTITVNSATYKGSARNGEQIGGDEKAVASVTLHKVIPHFSKTALPEGGTQESPVTVVYNSVLTYDLVISNPDPNLELTNVVVEDTIPQGLEVNNKIKVKIGDNDPIDIDSSPRVEYTLVNNTLTATIGTVHPNETIVIYIPATVTATDGSTFANTAKVVTVNGAELNTPIESDTTYHKVGNIQARIRKVNSKGEPLAGAVLQLYKVNDDATETFVTEFTSTTSPQIFDGIQPGTYKLREKTPPAVYYKTASDITFTIDVEGLTKVNGEYVTYVDMVNEPKYKVIFHENKPGGTADEIQKVFRIYEPMDLTDNKVLHFYDIPEWAGDEYVFAGWYHNNNYTECAKPDSAADIASTFENDTYSERDTDYHLYARWIQVGTVKKDAEDTNIISGYRGFGLAGVQIREPQMYDDNYTEITPGGLRFVTSLSEELLSSIDALSTTQVSTPEGYVDVEYGYAVGTEENINAFINNYNVVDTTAYTLQYKGENVNGKNTTVKGSGPNTDYRYITNVNCTKGTGKIAKDHRNFTNYRLYTLVVTYEGDSASKKAEKIDARSYIRYYDANGKLRVFYNDYRKNMYYGGCMCSYNQVSSMALPSNKAETEENP